MRVLRLNRSGHSGVYILNPRGNFLIIFSFFLCGIFTILANLRRSANQGFVVVVVGERTLVRASCLRSRVSVAADIKLLLPDIERKPHENRLAQQQQQQHQPHIQSPCIGFGVRLRLRVRATLYYATLYTCKVYVADGVALFACAANRVIQIVPILI